MSETAKIITGILIPLLGTTLGASMVFLIREEIGPSIQKMLLGFASGVMIAASVWSLLIPSIHLAKAAGSIPWLPAVTGFLLGIGFLLLLDSLIPHLHTNNDTPEGLHSKLGRNPMLLLAVTLHNIPEGMAVGVIFAGVYANSKEISIAGAFALSAGIAIQNFPEGAIISMPLIENKMSRKFAFLFGVLSGVVEPVFAVLTILLTTRIVPILPYILSFAAGAMIYVVIEELIPEAHAGKHSNIGTIGVAIGFSLMMVLDVALG